MNTAADVLVSGEPGHDAIRRVSHIFLRFPLYPAIAYLTRKYRNITSNHGYGLRNGRAIVNVAANVPTSGEPCTCRVSYISPLLRLSKHELQVTDLSPRSLTAKRVGNSECGGQRPCKRGTR